MASLPKCNTDGDSIYCFQKLWKRQNKFWGEENELSFGHIGFKMLLRHANGYVKSELDIWVGRPVWRCVSYQSIRDTQMAWTSTLTERS